MFDEMTKDDIVLAFFPCTMFEEHNAMFFRGDLWQQKNHTAERKLEDAIDRHETLHEFYTLICKLFLVCLRKGLRLVVENPYAQPHYLTLYFPIKPALIDNDRRNNGDKMKKPTQFWFVNFEPKRNLVFEPITYKPVVNVETIKGADLTRRRSEIEGEYASRFIRQFIL